MGCGDSITGTDPTLKEGSTITADVALTPSITYLNGDVTYGPTVTSKISAVVRRGKASLIGDESGRPFTVSGEFPSTDAAVAALLSDVGFTTQTSPNPSYSSAISGGLADTLVIIDDATGGTPWEIQTTKGSYGQPISRRYLRNNQLIMVEARTWTQLSGGVTLTRVMFTDYSNPEAVVRTNIDITSTRVVILSWAETLLNRVRTLVVGLVQPQPAYAQTTWECVSSAGIAVGSLINLVVQSAALVSAGAATAGTGGAASPTLVGAMYNYMGAIGWFSVSVPTAFVNCGASGGGKKTVHKS
jgi:hypothetical protein